MFSEREEDQAFSFGSFTLLPRQQALLHFGRPVRLGARALEILHLLVERAGQLVTKRELMSYVWPDVFVEEANLKVHVSSLRRSLGDTLPHPTYIATIPGRGYRFVAAVSLDGTRANVSAERCENTSDGLPDRSILIGREGEIVRIELAVRSARVVTLMGPGGVGKTTLAIEAAHRLSGSFEAGTCFVDASSTEDPTLVPLIVAGALGLRGFSDDPVGKVVDHLVDHETLVVLDNCEHVLHAAAMLAQRMAQSPTRSVLLATSREPLGGAHEISIRIDPFDCPADTSDLQAALDHPSVALFALRAAEIAEYHLKDEDASTVGRICEALDGLPLALELAAAMLVDHSPAQVLASLGNQTALLHTPGISRSRHVTLWSAFDWSYRLLSRDEATVFGLLSVFAGVFDVADVTAIVKVAGLDAHRTTMALGQLIAKSLVQADAVDDVIRYRLLDSARSYAFGRLSDDSMYRDARSQHARRVLSLLLQAEQEWSWLDTRSWRDRYDWRSGDLRKALNWCLGKGGQTALGIDLASAAIRLWNGQSALDEQLHWVDRALGCGGSAGEEPRRLVKLAAARAWGMVLAGRLGPETDASWKTAVDLACDGGELTPRLAALFGHGVYLIYSGRNRKSLERLTQFTDLAECEGDVLAPFDADRLAAMARIHLGEAPAVRRMLERQVATLQGGLPPSRITRYHEERQASINSNLALATWITGDPDQAGRLIEDNILLTENVGQLMGQSNILSLYALPIAVWRDDRPAIARHCGNLERNLARESIGIWRHVLRFYRAYLAALDGGDFAASDMGDAVASMLEQGLLVRTPMYMGLNAEMLLRSGNAEGGLRLIEEALLQARSCEEPWCRPELLRIKAIALSLQDRLPEAAATLLTARREAEETGSRGFELRIATASRTDDVTRPLVGGGGISL